MSPTVQQSLSILRVILYNEHQNLDLLSDLAGAFERDKYIPPMTKKQEIRVLLEMSRLLRKKLSEYPRTISGDIALVRTGKMSQVELDILHITIMEKVQLRDLMETCESIVSLALIDKEEALRRVHDDKRWEGELQTYIINLVNM